MVALPMLLVGGTEVHTLRLVRTLVTRGYDVTVCCYYESDAAMTSRFEAIGASVRLLGRTRGESLARLLLALIRLFRKLAPDLVHVQYVAPGFVPVLAARLAGVRRVIATVHVAGASAYGWKAKVLLRTAARLADVFICVSKGVERFWFGSVEERPGKSSQLRRHFTIYNAVDADSVGPEGSARAPELSGLGRPLVGVVGRLTHQKGIDVLLRAFPQVARAIPDARLVVVGDGADRAALQRQSEILGFAGSVTWLGSRSQGEVRAIYDLLSVLAVPSRYEGFGLVAAEAMAAAVPVVASDVEGLAEVVERDVTGVLVPPEDPGQLASALISVLRDPARARTMGEKGMQRVSELYSASRFEQEYAEAYRALLAP